MECFVASSFLCKRNSYLIKVCRSEKKGDKISLLRPLLQGHACTGVQRGVLNTAKLA